VNHFVTVFDSCFVPQGLALYESLVRHASPVMLWVVCMDDKAFQILDRLALKDLQPIPLHTIETPELLSIKRGRTLVEYCWTLTPLTLKAVFDRDSSAERVTYVDADLWFLKSPEGVFEEFKASNKSVLITEHAYDAANDRSRSSGRFCVQFITFVRGRGEIVRSWWQDRCLEWCFARRETGKYGDQKYLDDWPERFGDHVHVLSQSHPFLAPWNTGRFHYSQGVAWHFHGLRLLGNGDVLLHPGYSLPAEVERKIYQPYLEMLRSAVSMIGEPVNQPSSMKFSYRIPPWIRSAARRALGALGMSSW
jgi:hypothetical protein